MNIEIAGVTFSINCQGSIPLQDFNQTYNSFLITDHDPPDADIYVTLELHTMPHTSKLKKIFDSGQSWSMFQNGDSYFVSLNPSALYEKPIWIAQFDPHVKRVIVYQREFLIQGTTDSEAIPNHVCYPLDQILLMYYLAQREGALIHAAGLCFHDKGYIFPGKSGAGKSTISRQLTEIDDYEFLSDDRIIVRKMDKTFKAFGTPWPGEAGIAVNKSVDLSGIFFISQASYNKIEEIKPQKAMERLLPVVSIPWYDKEVVIKILDFCEDLISNVPVYELYFKPDIEVADVFGKFVTAK